MGSKEFWILENLCQKEIFWPKRIGAKQSWVQKKMLCLPTTIVLQKSIGSKKICFQNNLDSRKIWGPTKIFGRKNFGFERILGSKNLSPKEILGQKI